MIAINLLDWRLKYINIKNTRFYVITSVVALICFVITLSTLIIIKNMTSTVSDSITYINSEIVTVDGKIKDIKDLQDQKSLLISRRQVIESLQSNRYLAVTIFDNLIRTIPEGVVLESLSRKGTELDLQGSSDSNYNITVFVENMQKLPWVKEAKLTQIKTDSTDNKAQAADKNSAAAPIQNSTKINFQLMVTINANS